MDRAIAFGMWGCDRRFEDVEGAIAFGDVGGAIAVLRVLEGALALAYRRYRCLGMLGSAIAFGDVGECDRCFGDVESAIAFSPEGILTLQKE